MLTKYGAGTTYYIGPKAASNVFHAARFATERGEPLNTMITIDFDAIGVDDDQAGYVFKEVRARVTRWHSYQRKKGVPMGRLPSIHAHANPAGRRHVHWVVHVAPAIAPTFSTVVADRLCKIIGQVELVPEAVKITSVYAPGGLTKYILKGINPAYADHFHMKAANEGVVFGRRTGVSRAISKAARLADGWKRK